MTHTNTDISQQNQTAPGEMSLRRFGELLVLVVSNPGPCTGDFAESTRRFCTESIAHIFCSDFLPDSDKEAVLLFLKSTVAEIAALQSRREAERQCAKTIVYNNNFDHGSVYAENVGKQTVNNGCKDGRNTPVKPDEPTGRRPDSPAGQQD